MKVTLTVINKVNQTQNLVLFGARYNLLKCNFGNNVYIEFSKIEADDEYKETIGDFIGEHNHYTSFMTDIIRHNLIAVAINGKKIRIKPKFNLSGRDFKMVEMDEDVEINTYSEEYHTLVFGGENKFEIEFKNKSFDRNKIKLLI